MNTQTSMPWKEEKGTIRFSVKSDNTTGLEWVPRLKKKGVHLSREVEQTLGSTGFKPTNAVEYEVVILTDSLFEDKHRTLKNARAMARQLGLIVATSEIGCLVSEALSDVDTIAMGFRSLVVMKFISCTSPELFVVGPRVGPKSDGLTWVDACLAHSREKWRRGYGFMFVVPQKA